MGGSGSAAAQQDDFLPRYLNSVAPEVLGVAATVGVVAHQDAVLIDDGIHRLDGLGRGVSSSKNGITAFLPRAW